MRIVTTMNEFRLRVSVVVSGIVKTGVMVSVRVGKSLGSD